MNERTLDELMTIYLMFFLIAEINELLNINQNSTETRHYSLQVIAKV